MYGRCFALILCMRRQVQFLSLLLVLGLLVLVLVLFPTSRG